MAEYKLPYTGKEIEEKLGKISTEGIADIVKEQFSGGIGYSESSETVILPEATYTLNAMGEMQMCQMTMTLPLSIGNEYKVVWNGVEYICTCADFNGIKYVGDVSIMAGGDSTGEPFVVITSEAENATGIATLTNINEVTISICEFTETIHTISAEYLPANIGGGDTPFVFGIEYTDDGLAMVGATMEELTVAYQEGKRIGAYTPRGYIPMTNASFKTENRLVFTFSSANTYSDVSAYGGASTYARGNPQYYVYEIDNGTIYEYEFRLSSFDDEIGLIESVVEEQVDTKVESALQSAKESGEFKGEDGISATHTWNGTTLSITSASGTSSADLKGEKGYTPVKGTDYWTEADKEEINADNITYMSVELAKREQLKPEFAESLEWLKANGDTTKLYVLPDGYIYASVEKTVEEGVTPNFTNRLPLATDMDGSVYNGVGYKSGIRLDGSGNASSGSGNNTTGFISCKLGDIVRFENLGFSNETANGITASNKRICFYDSNRTFISVVNANQIITNSYFSVVADDGINITQITVANYSTYDLSNVAYFRICGHYIGEDTIITVNEEISYTTVEGGTYYQWVSTGHAFVPADYEERIIKLETDLDSAEKRIETLENSEISATQSNTTPQAVIDGVSALVDKSLSRADENVLRFVIYSDAHQYNENAEITKGNIELGKAIGEVVNQIGVDFVSGLGDYSWAAYRNTAEEVKAQIKQFNKFVNPYIKGEQVLNCEGNHDDAVYSTIDNDGDGTTSSTEKLSLAETYSLIYARNKNIVFDADHYIDGYCYKDIEHLKVRVICLNTEQGTGEGGVVADYQLTWLEEVALGVADDWQVVTLAHHPFSYGTSSLSAVVEIIDNFIKSGGKYIGHFHGHAHAFSVVRMQRNIDGTYTDINAWEICIPNACFSRNNQYLGNTNTRLARYSTETTYNKSNEDGLRTSFNLVTVDLINKIIYADNYGAGIDREITY